MKTRHLVSLLTATSILLGGSTLALIQPNIAQAKPAEETTKLSDPVQLLFVQNAIGGTFDGTTLTLKGVGPTLFFSDRPERVTGQVTTPEFISHWDKGSDNFASNPPNATLSIFTDKGVESVVVELNEPKLENNTLSYRVKVLKGTVPNSFKEASLFIDILGRWRMYSYGYAAGAASAGGGYYYHPPVVAPVVPVAPVVTPVPPVVTPPIYVAPRPIVVY